VLAESEGWTPTVPYLGYLKAYGCTAIVLDHDIKRGEKFTPRGLTGQLVGYEFVNIYKIWIPSLHKVVRSTNVTFDEASIGAASLEADNDPLELVEVDLAYPHTSSGGKGVIEEVLRSNEPILSLSEPEPESPLPSGLDDAFDDQTPIVGSTTGPARLPAELAPSAQAPSARATTARAPIAQALADQTTPTKPRRSQRTRQPTLKAREADAYLTSTDLSPKIHFAFTAVIETSEVKAPKSFTEATSSPQAKHWLKACQTEVDSLRKNKAWELVKLPEGATTVKGKWVFKLKLDENGGITRYKARWAARGFTQIAGIDYDETYAAVAKPVSIRILMAIVTHYNLECKQYDSISQCHDRRSQDLRRAATRL
jgi:hypothetical protein